MQGTGRQAGTLRAQVIFLLFEVTPLEILNIKFECIRKLSTNKHAEITILCLLFILLYVQASPQIKAYYQVAQIILELIAFLKETVKEPYRE